MLFLIFIAICAAISLGFLLIDKILGSNSIIGDIANIIRWVLRKWWLVAIIVFVLVVLGVIKI